MAEKAFGHDPIGSSPVPTHAGESHRPVTTNAEDAPLVTPVSFSSTGDVARSASNEADSYSQPHPLTPSQGPSYDKDHFHVPFAVEAGPLVEICRDLEYDD